jgi:hypothetical protein
MGRQLLSEILELEKGVLRCCILDVDHQPGETALALAERLGHVECQAILTAQIQRIFKSGESMIIMSHGMEVTCMTLMSRVPIDTTLEGWSVTVK